MGSKLSVGDKVEPSELNDIQGRNFNSRCSENSDDFKTKTRSTTDVCFLLFFSLFLTVLLCFLGYCVMYGDIFRVINGYDNCGEICGNNRQTKHDPVSDSCYEKRQEKNGFSGQYHIILRKTGSKDFDRLCVPSCDAYPGYKTFFNRCIQNRTSEAANRFFSRTGLKNFFSEVTEDFHLCWREFCYLCLISFALSIVILAMFRYFVGLVVWVVLIGAVLGSLIGSTLLWILWKKSKDENDSLPFDLLPDIDSRKTDTYLAFAIITTVATVLVILIIVVMRKRIQLVVRLFEESGKALAAMPPLLFEPILTFLSLGVIVFLWFYFSLWIESSGLLSLYKNDVFYYKKTIWMKFTRWYNFFAMLWMAQFVIACQHMVIAGAVSSWYFARNKSKLDSPIVQSAHNLTRYHLGSVALGSFIIALVQLARVVLKFVEKYLRNKEGKCADCVLKCCQCCLYCFEKVLKYLSRNAYIEVATYGYSFCRGGKQAFKLLSTNVLRVAAVNSVGDFVLLLGKVVVVMATVLIGVRMLQHKEGVHHMWVLLTLAGLFAYFISHCFMTVYEMAIDTIFLCFCEDCEQNDGIERPYFMSRGLMEFVENSKKALKVLDDTLKRGEAWEGNVSFISGNSNRETRQR